MLFLPRLLLFLYALCRSLTGQGRTTFDLQQWAEECDMEIVALEPCGVPPYSVERRFPYRASRGEFRYRPSISSAAPAPAECLSRPERGNSVLDGNSEREIQGKCALSFQPKQNIQNNYLKRPFARGRLGSAIS
jgi:hypothetical protein